MAYKYVAISFDGHGWCHIGLAACCDGGPPCDIYHPITVHLDSSTHEHGSKMAAILDTENMTHYNSYHSHLGPGLGIILPCFLIKSWGWRMFIYGRFYHDICQIRIRFEGSYRNFCRIGNIPSEALISPSQVSYWMKNEKRLIIRYNYTWSEQIVTVFYDAYRWHQTNMS